MSYPIVLDNPYKINAWDQFTIDKRYSGSSWFALEVWDVLEIEEYFDHEMFPQVKLKRISSLGVSQDMPGAELKITTLDLRSHAYRTKNAEIYEALENMP